MWLLFISKRNTFKLMTKTHFLNIQIYAWICLSRRLDIKPKYDCCFFCDFREVHSRQPVPFLPGDSINDSLLMNDLDENTQLRNAVAKLTRRVQDLEDNDKTRSYILYPTVLVLSLKLLYDVFIKSK